MGGLAVGRAAVLVVLLSAHPAIRLSAQDSQFGIRGLGTPGRQESVRARATGGAFAPFDAFSPLLDASLADLRRLGAAVTGGTSWRTASFAGSESALRATRFPALVIAGPLTGRVVVGGGFATYLDRTFAVTHDSAEILRGELEPYSDEIRSDGGVTDVRLAAAARLREWFALGVGVHRITGSTRVSATRRFEDSTNYRTSSARSEVAYDAWGGSASALLDLGRDVRVAAWVRSDTKLRAEVQARTTAEDDLPLAFGGGVRWLAGSQVGVAASVAWHRWGTGAGAPPNSHDTFTWSAGAEIGSFGSPFRFGVRGGTLPFGVGEAPTEFGLAAGYGRQFSGGRGRIDFGLERLERKGGGMTERVWTFLLGLTVRP